MNAIDAHIKYALVNPVSPLYAKWAIICAFSAALERRVWLDSGNHGWLAPNIYTLLVGPQGNGKSSALKLAENHLQGLEINWGSSQVTPAALIQEFSNAYRRIPYNNTFIPQSALFIAASELARFFNDFGGGSLLTYLLEYYDSPGPAGPESHVLKKRTKKDGEEDIINPSLVLLGATTPEYIELEVKRTNVGKMGLDSRIIFVPDDNFYKTPREFNKGDEALAIQVRRALTKANQIVGPMKMMPEAQERFYEFQESVDLKRESYHMTGALLENFYSRMVTNTLKVTMCVSVAREADFNITLEDMNYAIAAMEELEPIMHKTYPHVSMHKDEQLEMKLYRLIPKTGWISESQLLERVRKAYNAAMRQGIDYEGALEYLHRAELIMTRAGSTGRLIARGKKEA